MVARFLVSELRAKKARIRRAVATETKERGEVAPAGGIRTLETLKFAGFSDQCLKPLGHDPIGGTGRCYLNNQLSDKWDKPRICLLR